MALDPLLLDVLACPVDKQPLLWFEDEEILYNPRLHKSYPVIDGVPVLLVGEASDVSDAEHERLSAKAEKEGVRGDRAGGGVTHPDYLDTLGLWDATASLPEQVEAAEAAAAEVVAGSPVPSGGQIHSVVIFGMGTGALVGHAVAAYAADRAPVPVWVGNGYSAPSFVGAHTLAFAVSYSGDTEETIAATTAALERGADVVVVSGGGELARIASSADLLTFAVPAGLPAARTALGALLTPVLTTLSHLGLLPGASRELQAALATLRRRRDTLAAPGGPAGDVARRIGRTIPLVYGSTGVTAVAARRWKTQINQNAKTPAFGGVLPELSHNEVAGWGHDGDVTRQVLSLVTLRHADEHRGVSRRFDLVVDATDEVVANVIPVWAEGNGDLGRFLDLALFGDFVSLHMAGREAIDPGPTPALSDVESGVRSIESPED